MQVNQQTARAVANEYADEIVEAVERHLGIELADEQYAEASTALVADLEEAIPDIFGELE